MPRTKNSARFTKYLCLDCRKTLKREVEGPATRTCANCGGEAVRMGHRFRAPALSKKQEWDVVLFLVRNGFYFDRVYVSTSTPGTQASLTYPTSMQEAKAFVEQWADYAQPLELYREQYISANAKR